MSKLSLVNRVLHLVRRNYIDIEIRSDCMNKRELSDYTASVLGSLKEIFPEFSVIIKRYSRYLEIHRHPLLAVHDIRFSGYFVRIVHNIDSYGLKKELERIEMDGDTRVADIDLYMPDNSKISRKT